MATLYRADLVTADARPDLEELAARGSRLRRQRLMQYFLNPLALRLPLIDPDRILARAAAALAPVPGWAWVSAWMAVVAAGAAVAATNWDTLTDGFLDRVFSFGNLFALWLAYPLVKLLHETAHGLAIRRYGGQVHEMGIMLLVLVPVPYVEASAAAAFASKRARMLVGAAGILTELFLAGAAMILWALVEPGPLRAVLFNVALIGSVSSLFLNGNPLLRFDGYYVLADWLEIPNLGTRSNAYLGYLAQRRLFGLRDAASPAATPGEARWLLAYGLLSAAYRVVIVVGIVLLVASRFFFVGVLLAIWGAALMLVRPVAQGAMFLVSSPQLEGRRRQAVTAVLGIAAVAALLIFVVPAPQWTRTEGVVWAPERSHVRAGTACFVRAVLADPGQPVSRGQPLLECEDPELAASVRVLQAQLAELRSRDLAYFVQSRLHADVVREEIAVVEARLAEARRRQASLVMASPADGRFVMPGAADAPGRYAQRGEPLAYVIEPGEATVRVVVDQSEVDLVRASTRSVAVRPADRVAEVWPATVSREVPGAAERLPSLALAVQGGGRFGLDPRAAADSIAREIAEALSR